jgi:hypothetical protein
MTTKGHGKMKNILAIAALAIALGAGVASAQETDYISPPRNPHTYSLRLKLAQLRTEHAYGIHTFSAVARNVGPTSSATAVPDEYLGSAASGMPSYPGAPVAGNSGSGGK